MPVHIKTMKSIYKNMEQESITQFQITKNDRKIISDFAASLSEKEYKLRCMWAIQTLESKLTMINLELQDKLQREVVVRLTHRIKSAESIFLKLRRKGYTINLDNAKKKLNDIIGVRVTSMFRDDIYAIMDCLKIQHDIKIVKIKDYIKNPKASGYQGVHMILSIPIYLSKKAEWMKVELQLRTVAMDSWSVLDYQLLYKKEHGDSQEIMQELRHYSDMISDMDIKMMRLRDKIMEI